MRKFTTLKEDLIKENFQVQRKFEEEFNSALTSLDDIGKRLFKFKKKYEEQPGNWGYVGSIEHVNELFDEILEFLVNDKDENDNEIQ